MATTSGSGIAPAAQEVEDCFSQLPRQFGRYLLLRLLARGGMGQVYLASTTGVEGAERPIVIKVIRREHARDPNFLARFLDEARVQSQLQHSGVAQILEAATHEPTGDPYVAIEFVEGKSLGSVRRRIGDVGMRLRWEDAVAIGTLVSEALAHIHERADARGRPLHIVHRDLSPHNVMVGYGGEVKIIDFGTARGQNRRCHTVAGVVFAKPGYVAPEVANGDSGDFRVDLYAVGVMLWELCAGRRFLNGDPADHMAAVARGERNPPPIATLIGAPPELDEVIARMIAFERDDRYESSRVASSAMAALLREARPLPNGERSVRARVSQLMYNLYPSMPGRSRREFSRLVREARANGLEEYTPPTPANTSVEHDVLPGTRYRLRGELGRGSSSIVYEAEHIDLGRRVAVKVLDAEHTHSSDFLNRFRREARALSRLHHPGIVRVHDFGQADDGRMFCVMELLEGDNLRDVLEREERISWKRALRIARQAAVALQAAHERGIVHRDTKPANLFLTNSGEVKLIDFGLARSPDEAEPLSNRSKRAPDLGALTLFGTPEYMAPEQVASGRVDHRADLYALGCVMYEMLSGSLPFAETSAVATLDAKMKGSPEPLAQRVPRQEIPKSVGWIVMKSLARHPSRRFDSAEQLADALASAIDEPTRRRSRRRVVSASLFAATMGFALMLVWAQASPWLDDLPNRLPWLDPPKTQKAPEPPKRDRAPVDAESSRPRHAGSAQLELPEVVIAASDHDE